MHERKLPTAVCHNKRLNLPRSVVRPQDPIADMVGKIFGGLDIEVDADPEFSRSFVIQGDDEIAVRSIFTQGVRRVLLQVLAKLPEDYATRDAFRVEVRGNALLVDAPMIPRQQLVHVATAIMEEFVEFGTKDN